MNSVKSLFNIIVEQYSLGSLSSLLKIRNVKNHELQCLVYQTYLTQILSIDHLDLIENLNIIVDTKFSVDDVDIFSDLNKHWNESKYIYLVCVDDLLYILSIWKHAYVSRNLLWPKIEANIKGISRKKLRKWKAQLKFYLVHYKRPKIRKCRY